MNTIRSDAVRSSTRVEDVYEKLRANIVLGHHQPGSPLRMSELVDEYGVSLIPIREALRRLEVERLVESSPNRGSRVATASIEEVEDAYETRRILESEALRRAWTHLDEEVVEQSQAVLQDMFDGSLRVMFVGEQSPIAVFTSESGKRRTRPGWITSSGFSGVTRSATAISR
ncbi:MAG: GntR family transcriptional regulator [Acidimicrobiia bacterium]